MLTISWKKKHPPPAPPPPPQKKLTVPFETLLALQEALGKCGGDKVALADGIKAGRILRTQKNGLWMYWFPKFEYSRENLFKKALQGSAQREAESFEAFAKAEDSQFGFTWEANAIINEGLGGGPSALPTPSSSSLPLPVGGGGGGPSSSTSTKSLPLQNLVVGAGAEALYTYI